MRSTFLALGVACLTASGLAAQDPGEGPGVAPDTAWHMLALGNDRFASGLKVLPHQDAERRRALTRNQEPWAVVVGDADSRVVPEFVFDQGLGDLYDVRTAGSVVTDDAAVASAEYAVDRLGARLIVVLGHSGDGVVRDALRGRKMGASADRLDPLFKPALDQAKDKVAGLSGDALEASAVEFNVLLQMKRLLKASPDLRDDVESGHVKVVGGVYDLATGRVHWLGEHPDQQLILEGKLP